MVAGEVGKIGIVQRAKNRGGAAALRYKRLRETLRSALLHPQNARGLLGSAEETFQQISNDASQSAFARDDAEKSLDALQVYPQLANALGGLEYAAMTKKQPKLVLSGVQVSVNLDLMVVQGAEKTGIGGLIFRLTKPGDEETESARAKRRLMGLHAATLIQMHIDRNYQFIGTVQPKLCWSVDVQSAEVFKATRRQPSKEKELEAACRMIAAIWDSV